MKKSTKTNIIQAGFAVAILVGAYIFHNLHIVWFGYYLMVLQIVSAIYIFYSFLEDITNIKKIAMLLIPISTTIALFMFLQDRYLILAMWIVFPFVFAVMLTLAKRIEVNFFRY